MSNNDNKTKVKYYQVHTIKRYKYGDNYRYKLSMCKLIKIDENHYKVKEYSGSYNHRTLDKPKKIAALSMPHSVEVSGISDGDIITQKCVDNLFKNKSIELIVE